MMSDNFFVGSPEPGWVPPTFVADEPAPIPDDVIDRIHAADLKAVTDDLHAQGAYNGSTPGDRIFAAYFGDRWLLPLRKHSDPNHSCYYCRGGKQNTMWSHAHDNVKDE